MWKTVIVFVFLFGKGNTKDCIPYTVKGDVVACICNSTYCDYTPKTDLNAQESGNFYWYVSNKEGDRLQMSIGKFNTDETFCRFGETLILDRTKKYQRILGFGGAFTDSSFINMESLSPPTQDQLIRAYFDPEVGSRYNLGRIPVACTDFSIRPYSYDSIANDTSLRYFSLQPEDYKYKIPYANKARELNPTIKFLASTWSAPGWMKTSEEYAKFGYLKKEHYQTFANYLVKFAEGYKEHGIDIWAITTGNEPTISPHIHNKNMLSMGWTAKTMAEWVATSLGPTLASSKSKHTVILALDDDRYLLPHFVEPILGNEASSKYTIGTAVHWYFPYETPITVLDETHNLFPNKIILMTEASRGPPYWGRKTIASDMWKLGERYIMSIIQHLKHWAVGWVDWNLVLNKKGGPSWSNSSLNAAIVVNPETDEFYKLPAYYAIAHFSKFLDRDSIRISITDTKTVKSAAFMTPSKEIVVVLYNKKLTPNSITIADAKKGTLQLELSPLSMNTIIYKQ